MKARANALSRLHAAFSIKAPVLLLTALLPLFRKADAAENDAPTIKCGMIGALKKGSCHA
jgi:hypothetical protein